MRETWVKLWTDHLHGRLITQDEALQMARALAFVTFDAHAALSYAVDSSPKSPEQLCSRAKYAVESLIVRGAQ